MILNVLNEFYRDEYSMLEYLATGDLITFQDFANLSHYYTNHLLGYGIIEKPGDTYNFKIESVKQYL
jgi:signal peptidase I